MSTFAQTLDATLSSERFFYLEFNVDSASELQAMTDDPVVTDVTSFLPTPFTLDDAARFLKDLCTEHERVYGGWRKSDYRLVSLTGAHLNPDGKVETGYSIGAKFRGAGYGFEAANAMLLEIQTSSHLLKSLGSKKRGLMGQGPAVNCSIIQDVLKCTVLFN